MTYWFSIPSGSAYPAVLLTANTSDFRDEERTILITPQVKTAAINYYNCDEIDGMPLSLNTDYNDLLWDGVTLSYDIMSGDPIDTIDNCISPMTLAALTDTGWYTVASNLEDGCTWGRGSGCDFVFRACDQDFREYCMVMDQWGVDYTMKGKGTC
jgi:Leishmanolysin